MPSRIRPRPDPIDCAPDIRAAILMWPGNFLFFSSLEGAQNWVKWQQGPTASRPVQILDLRTMRVWKYF